MKRMFKVWKVIDSKGNVLFEGRKSKVEARLCNECIWNKHFDLMMVWDGEWM